MNDQIALSKITIQNRDDGIKILEAELEVLRAERSAAGRYVLDNTEWKSTFEKFTFYYQNCVGTKSDWMLDSYPEPEFLTLITHWASSGDANVEFWGESVCNYWLAGERSGWIYQEDNSKEQWIVFMNDVMDKDIRLINWSND